MSDFSAFIIVMYFFTNNLIMSTINHYSWLICILHSVCTIIQWIPVNNMRYTKLYSQKCVHMWKHTHTHVRTHPQISRIAQQCHATMPIICISRSAYLKRIPKTPFKDTCLASRKLLIFFLTKQQREDRLLV